ncbi:MAG TPA: hypothetical protein VI729_01860 [Anaerolineales bacterium]|jgi:hypothetical protein|nr:hypothetical protein [Anaerolineales bacterium]
MMINDFPTLIRARGQEIDREIQAMQLQAGRQARRPGRIARSLVQAFGRLGTVLVTVGRRLECYAYRIRRQSDGLQATG